MYYTQTEIINLKLLADAAITNSAILDDLIKADKTSKLKTQMIEGQKYYNGQHDYLDHKNYFYTQERTKIELQNRANNLITVQFYTLAEDQKIEYIIGKSPTISVNEPWVDDESNPTPEEEELIKKQEKFQTAIIAELGKKFPNTLSACLHGASRKAIEWIHFYVDITGKLQYVITPAEQIIPIYDVQYENKLIEIIRYYEFQLIDTTKNERVMRYKLERWTDKDVTYYQQDYEGNFSLDLYYPVNPYPHWMDENKTLGIKTPHGWGKVPFVPVYNNTQGTNDLTPIKFLIDAYDKVFSGWANDLEDIKQLLLVIKGYLGLNKTTKNGLIDLENLLNNIYNTGAIVIDPDKEADVKNLKQEIPVEAREKFLKICRDTIFEIGRIADPKAMIGGTITNVAIKTLYAGLDMKCNAMISILEESLEEMMWFIVTWINRRDRTNYDYKEINFTFNKSMIFNEGEVITNLGIVADRISEKTFLENLPFIKNVDEEMARIEADRKRKEDLNIVNLDNVSEDMPNDMMENTSGDMKNDISSKMMGEKMNKSMSQMMGEMMNEMMDEKMNNIMNSVKDKQLNKAHDKEEESMISMDK